MAPSEIKVEMVVVQYYGRRAACWRWLGRKLRSERLFLRGAVVLPAKRGVPIMDDLGLTIGAGRE